MLSCDKTTIKHKKRKRWNNTETQNWHQKRENQSAAGSRPDELLHNAHALSLTHTHTVFLSYISRRDSRPRWKRWLCVLQSWKNTSVALLTHRCHWAISSGLSCAAWLLMWVSMTIKSLYILSQPRLNYWHDAKQRRNNDSLSVLIGQNKWKGRGKGVERTMESSYYMMWGGWCAVSTSSFSRAALLPHSRRR